MAFESWIELKLSIWYFKLVFLSNVTNFAKVLVKNRWMNKVCKIFSARLVYLSHRIIDLNHLAKRQVTRYRAKLSFSSRHAPSFRFTLAFSRNIYYTTFLFPLLCGSRISQDVSRENFDEYLNRRVRRGRRSF